jgi:Ca-activated chloride channel family protein
MIFGSPLWLLGLLALPLLVLGEAWITRRDRERTARLVARPLWARVLRRPPERWRFLRLALLLVGAAGILLALARPQWGIVREKVEREGVDVVLVLDTSGSMATEDVAPSRFFLARAAFTALVSRLEGDRFGLVAFAGEAYPLVPLTLDADAVGLFLETMEPGIVPAPGTSLGRGLGKGLDLFVDKERRNKVMVLVSDGEDLEGDVDEAVSRARDAGVVVHTVGVGTEAGQPVPDFDREGNRVGFKKDEKGAVVVSHLEMSSLESIARGTGGRAFRITPADTSLSALASAIEGMEGKTLAREYSYRRKERFQIPLAAGLIALALGLLLPPPRLRQWRRTVLRVAGMALVALPGPLGAGETKPAAASGRILDEILLRPRRLTEEGRAEYGRGNLPRALSAFEEAAALRARDPRARFNLADGLYKSGKLEEAAALYRALGEDPRSGLAAASRFNLGNALFQEKDYRAAVLAYRDALRLAPEDLDTRRNLELTLRALRDEERQKKQQERTGPDRKDQPDRGKQDRKEPRDEPQAQKGRDEKKERESKPGTAEQKEQERFRKEAGMPKERAMQLLDALQQSEKAEQRRLLAARKTDKRGGKDW